MANNIKYYFHKPISSVTDIAFNKTYKNSLQGEEHDLLTEDEAKYTKLFNVAHNTYRIKGHFVGFGNKKTNPEDMGNYLSDVKGKYSAPELPTNNVYINKQCGYQLTFPKNWLGWYYINDSNPECIAVYFFGKSMTGSFYLTYLSEVLEHEKKIYGLPMFMIMTEEIVNNGTYDSIRKIGTAHGTNYYFATSTDASLPMLTLSQDCWDDITKEELELSEKDWEKVEQMNYDDVINSFKEI